MIPQQPNEICSQIASLLVFYVCDEVTEQERVAIEKHLAVCAECRAQYKEEQEFHSTLIAAPPATEIDSTGVLLSQCRSELAEALDDIERPPAKEKTSPFAFLRHWLSLHPAWSAATLVLFGLVAGSEATRWINGRDVVAQAVDIRPNPQITRDQLAKMVVADVNFAPSPEPGSKNVRVSLSAEQPIELTGNVDDPEVRNVMTFVVTNSERFDSDVRLNCLEALRTRAQNSEVRSALLCAARRDQNPAVRLKALEALRASVAENEVRETLLQALKHDSNPGVRVEAVNLLVRSLEAQQNLPSLTALPDLSTAAPGNILQAGSSGPDGSMENVIRILGDLQHNDPSRYVRMRSAAALRQISARDEQ